MKKIIAYLLSVIYYLFFGLFLIVFHPIQWLALKLGGYNAHKKTVDYLNLMVMGCLYILGNRIKFNLEHPIPKNVPLIVASNHQSMNDIPPFFWFFRKYHPKFVAKKELEKGIPSISFNLKYGGSALIDRKDPKQSITTIINFAKYIEKNNYMAVIFPEGTRSRDGKPKRFSENGLKMLAKYAPSAYVIPVSINNSWKLLKYGGFPMEIGIPISFDVHKPIKVSDYSFSDLFEKVEDQIKASIRV